MGIKFRYVRDYFTRVQLRGILMWIFEIIVAIGLGAVVAIFFCQNIEMTEGSMEPVISVGDTLLVNNLAYRFTIPERGDLVVFRTYVPEDDDEEQSEADNPLHVKRVIGLPGETIQIRDGQILIDGITYMEQRDLPTISYAGLAENEIHLDDDEYFVLGDNRNNSSDSRYTDIGNVTRNQLVGKVWFRLRPYANAGFLK